MTLCAPILEREEEISCAESARTCQREVRAGLELCLLRLWRYALTLSKSPDVAEDLVQATRLRAVEHADEYSRGRG
jgi:DNA-directed RNA polymerase specialized sigma24 family protein